MVKGQRNSIVREERIELNPTDAQVWAISAGDRVQVQTSSNLMYGIAWLDESVPSGVVATTGLFGQLASDLQSSVEWDPASRLPGLQIVPAAVAKVAAPAELGVPWNNDDGPTD